MDHTISEEEMKLGFSLAIPAKPSSYNTNVTYKKTLGKRDYRQLIKNNFMR